MATVLRPLHGHDVCPGLGNGHMAYSPFALVVTAVDVLAQDNVTSSSAGSTTTFREVSPTPGSAPCWHFSPRGSPHPIRLLMAHRRGMEVNGSFPGEEVLSTGTKLLEHSRTQKGHLVRVVHGQ